MNEEHNTMFATCRNPTCIYHRPNAAFLCVECADQRFKDADVQPELIIMLEFAFEKGYKAALLKAAEIADELMGEDPTSIEISIN